MFLKEICAIFTSTLSILIISGFALKFKKFENNFLIRDSTTNQPAINLSRESFNKLNPRINSDFQYFIDSTPYTSKIYGIEDKTKYISIVLHNSNYPKTQKLQPIKYFIEYKTLWLNLFNP